jgi:hypothetical protein
VCFAAIDIACHAVHIIKSANLSLFKGPAPCTCPFRCASNCRLLLAKQPLSTNAAFEGTDVASSFCVPAEAVVASLKHVRAGSTAPVFVAVDTRSTTAFGSSRLPTALHVPVLAEDAVSIEPFHL